MGLWHVQSLLMCLIFWHHFIVTFKFEWEMISLFPVPFLASVGLLLQHILVCFVQYSSLVEIVISRQIKGCWSYLFFTFKRRNTFLANKQVKEQAVSTAFLEGVSHCRYGWILLASVRFPGLFSHLCWHRWWSLLLVVCPASHSFMEYGPGRGIFMSK